MTAVTWLHFGKGGGCVPERRAAIFRHPAAPTDQQLAAGAAKWPLVGLRSNPGAATYTEAVQILCLLPHAALIRGSVTAWVSPERLILPLPAALTP